MLLNIILLYQDFQLGQTNSHVSYNIYNALIESSLWSGSEIWRMAENNVVTTGDVNPPISPILQYLPDNGQTPTISYPDMYYIMRDSYAPTYFRVSFLDLKRRCHQVSICNFGILLNTTAVCVYYRNSQWLQVL